MKFHPLKGVARFVRIFKRIREPNTAILHEYPNFIFSWPIWFLGLFFKPTMEWHWIGPTTAGWTLATAILLVIITIGFKLGRNQAVFALSVITIFWLAGVLLQMKQYTFVGSMMNDFWGLKPGITPNFGLVISIPLMILAAMTFVMTRIESRWYVSPNTLEHYDWNKCDESYSRGAKTIGYVYDNTMKLLLLGAGSIRISNADGSRVLREIKNIPFLKLRERYFERLAQSVSVKNADEIEVQVGDEVDHSHELSDQSNEPVGSGSEVDQDAIHH